MGEKKTTKAQQRKLDAANRKKFISAAFLTVMTVVAKKTVDVSGSGTKLNIKFTSGNRYVNFDAYGRSLSVLIFKNGNVDVQLVEFCHNPHREQLFEFDFDQDRQNEFLKHFKKMLNWLIPEFFEIGHLDFHSFMDFVRDDQPIEKAHNDMLAWLKAAKEQGSES